MPIMKIKELREAAGLKQTELASSMGVFQNVISNWENEVALPRAKDIPYLARALGCSIDELFVPLEGAS